LLLADRYAEQWWQRDMRLHNGVDYCIIAHGSPPPTAHTAYKATASAMIDDVAATLLFCLGGCNALLYVHHYDYFYTFYCTCTSITVVFKIMYSEYGGEEVFIYYLIR
jgi:hypothetical protein